MFEFQRLAKEDYELMGRCNTWTDTDAITMLTSFEMEKSGEFGDSQELYQFNRLALHNAQGLEKTFHEKWSRWFNFIADAIGAGELLYANTPERDDPLPNPEATAEQMIGKCNVSSKELLLCISRAITAKVLDFDLETFTDYLLGKGNAPFRVKEVKEYVEILPEEYHRRNALKRHDADKPKHEAFKRILNEEIPSDCTCTKRQTVDRIFKDRFNEDENYLKSETGYGYLTFTRHVSKAIQEIENKKVKDKRINRHENTTGFSKRKIPSCSIHQSQ